MVFIIIVLHDFIYKNVENLPARRSLIFRLFIKIVINLDVRVDAAVRF